MARRATTTQIQGSMYVMNNTSQIFKESIRLMLLHPTHFHSISIFLFSPFPISLFLSNFLIHHFPYLPTLPFSKTMVHIIICFPSYITFSLLGRAATTKAVSQSYNGINLDTKRLLMKSGLHWNKLVHTSFWEFFIVVVLIGVFALSLTLLPKLLLFFNICSEELAFWGVIGVLGVPFCVAFAHVMVVGNLARVLSVLECDCYGFKSLLKAKSLMEGERKMGLIIALLSNVWLRLIECLFEFRMKMGFKFWEVSLLVSMYSLVLVFDTIMNVVFYYSCKSFND